MNDSTSPQTVKPKRHRQSLKLLLNLIFLAIIVLAVNYISCSRFERKDLTQDQRYTLSQQTIHLLSSGAMSERKTPIKMIFAFRRNTENYPRMRSLLEDYVRFSDNKIELECVDPLRSPNRAREIANTYGIEFSENMVIIDAREDQKRSLNQSGNKDNAEARFRFLPGSSFIVYGTAPDGKTQKAVALQMEDVVTSGLIGAMEGKSRPLYLIVDKSRIGREDMTDPNSLFATVEKITRPLNLQLIPTRISEVREIPENASGVMLIGPQYDLEPAETEILRQYWAKPNAGLFIMLDPASGQLNNLYRFLRENGIRPRADRILKQNAGRTLFETNAIFTPGPLFTRDFWNSSTALEGQSSSLKVEEGNDRLNIQRINPFPLLQAGTGYYGETKFDGPNPKFDAKEDYADDLTIAAGVERGNGNDVNYSKNTSRMTVTTNMDMLNPRKVRPDQRDFLKSALFWITNREELAGIGSRNDLTVKLDWDENTKSWIELFATILLPGLALLIAFILWRVRRS